MTPDRKRVIGMSKRNVGRVLATGLAAGGLVLMMGSPGNAAATETDIATAVSSVPSDAQTHCRVLINEAAGCFRKYGDSWYVQDEGADGLQTYVKWTNQLYNSSGNWVNYRTGTCHNQLGAYNWGVCNKDYYEDSSVNALGGVGSRVSFEVCVDGVISDTCVAYAGGWVYNDA